MSNDIDTSMGMSALLDGLTESLAKKLADKLKAYLPGVDNILVRDARARAWAFYNGAGSPRPLAAICGEPSYEAGAGEAVLVGLARLMAGQPLTISGLDPRGPGPRGSVGDTGPEDTGPENTEPGDTGLGDTGLMFEQRLERLYSETHQLYLDENETRGPTEIRPKWANTIFRALDYLADAHTQLRDSQ